MIVKSKSSSKSSSKLSKKRYEQGKMSSYDLSYAAGKKGADTKVLFPLSDSPTYPVLT